MKAKSILQCAALLTGLLFLNVPLFATVESDIVGYTEVTLKPGFNLLALPFDGLASDTGIDIKTVVQGTPTNLDQIQYWADGKLEVLVYYARNNVGWCSGLNPVADKSIFLSPGQGFWYKSAAAAPVSVRIAGRVATTGEETITTTTGFNLIGPPTPQAVKLSDLTFKVNNIEGVPNLAQIQYWNGQKLEVLVYYTRNNVGWCSGLNPVDITQIEFLPTDGFWFVTSTTGVTITFPSIL